MTMTCWEMHKRKVRDKEEDKTNRNRKNTTK